MKNKLKLFLELNILFLIYSFVSVIVKIASKEETINGKFIILYIISLVIMGLYALCWQQIIKGLPLIVAYANKAVVIVWGLIWGVLFFGESVTIGKLLGVLLVVSGVVIFATSESEASS